MSKRKPIQPVTEQQLATVRDSLKLISDAQPTIQALEACGEDCQHYRQQMEYYEKKLRQIHDSFFGVQ